MKSEIVKIEELKPLEDNVRRHNKTQVDELVRALDMFGQTRLMVIDEDNNILIGNGLYLAMRQRGDTEVACFRKTGLSEKDKKKLILSDNRIYALGVDDFDGITKYIESIAVDGDLMIPGFDPDVISRMTATLEEANEEVMTYGVITEPPKLVVGVPTPTTEVNTGQATPTPTPTPPVEGVPTVEPHKAVMCPNCGEVIHID